MVHMVRYTLTLRVTRAVLLAILFLLTSCGSHAIRIRDLLDDPARYDGEKVHVEGEVTENVGVLGYGSYRVGDRTESIMVLTGRSGAPRTGARLSVKGKFRSAFTLGEHSAAVIHEEEREAP